MRYDGVYRWHLSRAIPVLNHSGAILKWVGVTIDIGKAKDMDRVSSVSMYYRKDRFLT